MALCQSDWSSARPIRWVGIDAVPNLCIPKIHQFEGHSQGVTSVPTVVVYESAMFDGIHSSLEDFHRLDLDASVFAG